MVGGPMKRPPKAPHPDDLETVMEHFNAHFRHRYRLPAVTAEALRRDVEDLDDLLADLATAHADGVADASCALIARIVLSIVPQYAIGLLTGGEHLTVLGPDEGDKDSYGNHVLLVNPLGGRDNWRAMARWFRQYGGTNARRTLLAGLASEERPDEAANLELLMSAASTHGRAIALPPDEAFSGERAAEVSYIYRVPVDTLRSWKQRYRSGLAAKKPGAPRKNR
jgi:hypothetical protein